MAMKSAVRVKAVPRPIDATLRMLGQALTNAGLTVVGEFDLSRLAGRQVAQGAYKCALLLVDCPLLFFEAVALERSAAAFIPIHLVVTGDQKTTSIYWAHPAMSLGLRVSPTAERPLGALVNRVSEVLGRPLTWTDPQKERKDASALLRRRSKTAAANVQ